MNIARFFLLTLVVLSRMVHAEAEAKSFALFVAAYNQPGGPARGGVGGTVFFISPTEAITAYHVLQPNSFSPLSGFAHVRLWLVHEGVPAIELKSENLTFEPAHDLTLIHLKKAIAPAYVFATASVPAQTENVEAEGFRAESTGPQLAWEGNNLTVTSVPRLNRLFLHGKVLRVAEVNLKSSDIDMKSAPCVQLSYQPIVGFSGGPVLSNGKVVAMNSFADPGSRAQTWALRLNPAPPLAPKL